MKVFNQLSYYHYSNRVYYVTLYGREIVVKETTALVHMQYIHTYYIEASRHYARF